MKVSGKARVDFVFFAQRQDLSTNVATYREVLVGDTHVLGPMGKHIHPPHLLQLLLLVVEKPRMMTKQENSVGFFCAGVFQPLLEPHLLGVEQVLRTRWIVVQIGVQANVVGMIAPKCEVVVTESVRESCDRLGSGAIPDI